MCCAGCEAVAHAIVANGLDDYYRHRDALPESPREALPMALQEAGLFDHPDMQQQFVARIEDGEGHEYEAALIIEGITCAACVWLNEQHLARLAGVTAVHINYATRRARIRWDDRRLRLSEIIAAVAAIGYRAYPYDTTRADALARSERRAALWRLFVAGFGMMQVMMYALPAYLADKGSMTPDIEQLMRWASLTLTLPVILYSARPFFVSAWRDLRLGRAGMDVPVALGVGAAFGASVWATFRGSGAVYFDSVTMFLFFLLTGRYLELMARQEATRGIENLARALPAFASKLPCYPALDSERVAANALIVGDVVLVRPGESIPVNGEVLDGLSAADEALLTGESVPVAKCRGDMVCAGSINIESPLIVRVCEVGAQTRLAAIQRLAERAAAEKPQLVRIADRVAARFVVVLLVLACVSALLWSWFDPVRTLEVFVAVLVVSCPCALSLATPAALTVATGALSRMGVLVTRAHAIETLARARHFVFDKTGTLTEGRLALVDCLPLGVPTVEAALELAGALEQGSEHPIARALCTAAANTASNTSAAQPLPTMEVHELRAATGAGIEASIESIASKAPERMRIGSLEYAGALHGMSLPEAAQAWVEAGGTVVALASREGWLALFRLSDTLRREARAMVDGLRSAGVNLSILSGDSPLAVGQVAASLDIADAHGGLSSTAKHAFIERLQEQGAIVAMVGDGVNDAPVLAQAQVSIAMGGGTDLARSQGDIVLLSDNLAHLAAGIALARRTLAIVRQNLAWAAAYNLVAIPLAMAGMITPAIAGIGMSASSLLVVLNALRLKPGRSAGK